MRKVVKKVDQMLIAARGKVLQKKPAVDQIIIMLLWQLVLRDFCTFSVLKLCFRISRLRSPH
jgi:hypothetical protein